MIYELRFTVEKRGLRGGKSKIKKLVGSKI